VRILRAALGQGGASRFRVNIDGQYLYEGVGTDFEVPAGDSIMMRVEVTPVCTPGVDVEQIADVLNFTLESGAVQSLPLKAGVMDAVLCRGIHVTADTLISSVKPIVVYDSLVVDSGTTLTIGEGTTLMFHSKVGMVVRGTLKVMGTVEHPVVLRSDQTEHMFANLYYDNTPNRWLGIVMEHTSTGNELYNCDMHASNYGILFVGDSLRASTIWIENCMFHNMGGDGLFFYNCQSSVLNTQVSNTLGCCVSVNGGSCDFLHCTLAQFFALNANRGAALFLQGKAANVPDPESRVWLRHAHFVNCVITGYGTDVITGEIRENGGDTLCDYRFHHCYLNTVESKDTARFVGVVYDDDKQPTPREKNFTLFDTDRYLYDFTPLPGSGIRAIADTLFALPLDRLGRPRLVKGTAEAGCYETPVEQPTPENK
ncbi:MAG: right-handed parallel beta-helix repeat-containing protein, partial [Bacteroidaceae bacterium]|nr:right-handed parallel beta-helix repeat-containing protein [Bacteroidaceae bacterium]